MDKLLSAKEVDEAAVMAFDLHNSPGHLLRRCHQRSREVFNNHMADTNLSRQMLSVLICIYHNPGQTYSVLSEDSGFDRNTLAEMIDRLVLQKYATRIRSSADRRAYAVELTNRGKQMVRSIIHRTEQVQEEVLAPLPAEMRPVFIRCLRILVGLEKAAK